MSNARVHLSPSPRVMCPDPRNCGDTTYEARTPFRMHCGKSQRSSCVGEKFLHRFGGQLPRLLRQSQRTGSKTRLSVLLAASIAFLAGCSEDRVTGGLVAISAGNRHVCGITSSGQAVCWGSNELGQIGAKNFLQNNTKIIKVPALVALPPDVVSISAGWEHTCAISASEGVHCWGNNLFGLLGDGTTVSRRSVTKVSGLQSGAIAVSAGEHHTCVLADAGAVYCWGDNDRGTIAFWASTERNVPKHVKELPPDIVSISSGDDFSCAVMSSGEVLCSKWHYDRSVGNSEDIARAIRVPVPGLTEPVISVSAGDYYACALTAAKGVVCWSRAKVWQHRKKGLNPVLLRYLHTTISPVLSRTKAR